MHARRTDKVQVCVGTISYAGRIFGECFGVFRSVSDKHPSYARKAERMMQGHSPRWAGCRPGIIDKAIKKAEDDSDAFF